MKITFDSDDEANEFCRVIVHGLYKASGAVHIPALSKLVNDFADDLAIWHFEHFAARIKSGEDVLKLKAEIDGLRAELAKKPRKSKTSGKIVVAAKAVLSSMGTPCRLDHEGLCQEHYLGKPCAVALLREAVASETAVPE